MTILRNTPENRLSWENQGTLEHKDVLSGPLFVNNLIGEEK